MTNIVHVLSIFLMLTSLSATNTFANETATVRSKQSGPWSSKETWDLGRVPSTGDRVIISPETHVTYDIESRDVIRLVQIVGTLEFARDRSTQLNAGLISLVDGVEPTEEGFDCHFTPPAPSPEKARPKLLIGEPGNPIAAEHTATIRLHYVEGMNKESCPALINCGGRMEIHGTPMRSTWVKMKKTSDVGATSVTLMESVDDWSIGDQVIVTSTTEQREQRRGQSGGFLDRSQTETRRITKIGNKDFTGGYSLTLDRPLTFEHYADGEFCAEVANLTRNVVIESAQPDGVRGHTMIHVNSSGAISYAEFRHLGKEGVLGRYSIHYHLCGDTMRGSSVIGASIWDSHNRFLTIHGTDALVVRDCVGYKSIGHGFFLEDGSEINNVIDHNLAVTVAAGVPLPQQVIPFDPNRGAGFWFANCQNVFTRNVAAECAEYGYRFDCKKTDTFDPVLAIRQGDGTTKLTDTRTMPFIRFEGNEAHTMRFFCLNLRGVTRPEGGGLDIYDQNVTLAKEAAEAIPAPGYPFWIRDFKCWEANWAIHLGTTGVFVDGLNVYKADVALWRSIMDGSGYRRMKTNEMRVNDIHNPLSMGMVASESDAKEKGVFRGVSSFKDDKPPTTIVTSVVRDGNILRIEGSTADTSDLKFVKVNGRPARSTRGSFAEWSATIEAPTSGPFEIVACSEDVNGLAEIYPHRIQIIPPTKTNSVGTPAIQLTSDLKVGPATSPTTSHGGHSHSHAGHDHKMMHRQ